MRRLLLPAVLLTAGLSGLAAAPVFAQSAPSAPAARRLVVTVLDTQGLPISGARVTAVLAAGNIDRSATGASDQIVLADLPAGSYTVRVSAAGFETQVLTVDLASQAEQALSVNLKLAGITEQLVVTATRSEQRVADVPASVSVVSQEDILRSAAVVADDVLRQVPSFSLFRRTSSIAANPTAQGVSLRGIGPSGVSRTLVLLDDVPFNDPFGGNVFWTRVPLMNAERIEVVEGPSSSLYGNYAMGGVINIVTNRPSPRTLIFKPQYGNRATPKMDLFASDVWGRLGVTVDASALQTDGYAIAAPEERGAIDNEANVRFQNLSGRADYRVSDRVNVFFRAGYFDEKRDNGKIGELNDTTWTTAQGGARVQLREGSTVQARLFYDHEDYHQNAFAVPAATPPRSVTFLTLDKTVPSRAIGSLATWSRVLTFGGKPHVVTAGTDFRRIVGDSDERTYALATGLTPLIHRVAGGRQRFVGVFGQDIVELNERWQLTLSARVDSWRNYDAHNRETTLATGLPTAAHRESLPDKSDTAVSPRVAVLYRLRSNVSLWGSVSRAFRAPTLKELYSPFRVGAVLTLSNEALDPERLTGGEAGISAAPTEQLTVRGTVFTNRVSDAIANASVTANGLTRQVRNVGSTNISGVQLDGSYRFSPQWNASAAYVLDVAKVHRGVADATGLDLTGRYLAQVPRHRASFEVNYVNPAIAIVSLEHQFVGHQFDDDQNIARILPGLPDRTVVGLPGFHMTNLTATRGLTRQASLFVGVQNLFGTEYYVGTNPTTIGTPRLVNVGIRLQVGR
ncbi:MAG: TonB-dependent receptor [Vicinamibacterales bacterium]